MRKLPILVFCFFAMIAMLPPSTALASLSDGLMAYYPFDGTAEDMSENDNHGIELGNPEYKMGVSGDSISLDGVDDYIRIPYDPTLNPVDQLTVSCWVKAEGYINRWSPLVHKGGLYTSTGLNREYTVWLHDSSSFLFHSAGDNSAQFYQNTCCAGQDWTHYVGIIDRQNHRMQVYVDGILKTDVEDPYSTFNNNTNDLLVGWTEEDSAEFSPFKGRIDELRIYDRVLGEDEILELYGNGKAIRENLESGLVAHYPFDGTADDISGNSHHGTANGTTATLDKHGNSNSAYAFDGIDDYIRIPYHPEIEPSFFTIALWAKTSQQTWGNIITSDPDGAHCHHGYALGFAYQNIGYFHFGVDPSQNCNDGNAVHIPIDITNDGQWHHIVSTFGGLPELYVDGNFLGSGLFLPYPKTNAPVHIGVNPRSASWIGNNFFRGAMDDLRIYNRVLSSKEIKLLYKEGNGTNHDNEIGTLIQINQENNFTLEKNTQEEFQIQLNNQTEIVQSVTLEIINPNLGLSVAVNESNPIEVPADSSLEIPVVVDANDVETGYYDNLLLKVTTAGKETLYCTVTVTVTEQGETALPDLSVSGDDIVLSDYTQGESVTLKAFIKNNGALPATDIKVHFYEFDHFLGEAAIDIIAANDTATATIEAPITTSGEHLIQVMVDKDDMVAELCEWNNEANRIITWGTSSHAPGRLLVSGSFPSTIYTDELFTITGRAVYDVYVNGVRYTNYTVKGGSVQLSVSDDSGRQWVYGNIHTDTDGRFRKSLQAPADSGDYHITMTVTDGTFEGEQSLLFSAAIRPSSPPVPPAPPFSYEPGSWTYSSSSGTWTWRWSVPEGDTLHLESDLQVFSENIHFSVINPAPGEDTTIAAQIGYWANSSDLVAQDVPIEFFATYPGSETIKIGETVIDRLSVHEPDFGSRYVYTTWQAQNEGIHIIEVGIDPAYTEENELNNAATRAILVGGLEYDEGAVGGQIRDILGGVADVMVQLYDDTGSVMLQNQLTDETGAYIFAGLSAGEYQVHITVPEDYLADASVKSAQVMEQQVTEVNFSLTALRAPVADAGGPYTTTVGTPAILNAGGSYSPNGEIVLYEWDFDSDGTFDISFPTPNAEHTWDTAFNGRIQLRVTDNLGLIAVDTAEIRVEELVQDMCGDLDGDGDVDRSDRNIFRSALSTSTGDTGFIVEADYDGDGFITYNDYREWYACYKAFLEL